VAALFANHFVAMMRPHLDGNEIPHATRGHKQRRLFPKNLRRALFQPVDRRVLAVNVIPTSASAIARRISAVAASRIAPQVNHRSRNHPASAT